MINNSPEYKEVELPAIEQLRAQGYTYIDGSELSPDHENKERISYRDVVLVKRLKAALHRINPDISEENISKVIHDLVHVPAVSLIEANQSIWEMIVRYLSVEQDMGKGRKGQTVKIIDFEDIENNEFLVTNQFKVQGLNENIIPDIIVFINGLPIAVVECKSPTTTDPMNESIRQLMRYANRRTPEANEGAERLFWYNQLMVVSCRENAHLASVRACYEISVAT
jgi:type I restriction enzyme R subunit